jgi:hypothetical protein
MDSYDKSTFAQIKQVLILAKCAYLIFVTLKAAVAWRNNVRICFTLVISAVILGGVSWYKTTSKQIMPLFILQTMSMLMGTSCL